MPEKCVIDVKSCVQDVSGAVCVTGLCSERGEGGGHSGRSVHGRQRVVPGGGAGTGGGQGGPVLL